MSQPELKKFRLMGGKHQDDYGRKYVPGDIIASTKDLDVIFANIFQRVEQATPDKYHSQPLPVKTLNTPVLIQEHQTNVPTGLPVANQPPAPTLRKAIEADVMLDLPAMTAKELQQLAQDEGIDLKGASKKDDIIKIIQASQETAK